MYQYWNKIYYNIILHKQVHRLNNDEKRSKLVTDRYGRTSQYLCAQIEFWMVRVGTNININQRTSKNQIIAAKDTFLQSRLV